MNIKGVHIPEKAVKPSEKRAIRREIVNIQGRQRRLRNNYLDLDIKISNLRSRL